MFDVESAAEAFGNPLRQKIVKALLQQGECTVETLENKMKAELAGTAEGIFDHHLAILGHLRLINSAYRQPDIKKSGQWEVYISIDEENLKKVVSAVPELGPKVGYAQ